MISHENGLGKLAVGAARLIPASYGQGNQGRVDAPLNTDWTELVQFVRDPEVSSVTHSYYLSLPKNRPKDTPKDVFVETQGSVKEDSPFVLFGTCELGKRDDKHLLGRSAVTLDYDAPDCARLIRLLRLEALNVPFAYVWHTTRSHDINFAADRIQPKIRIIIPLSRDVSATEYRLLVLGLSKLFPATLDAAALKPSQMMYCPIRNTGAPYRCGVFEGDGYLEPDSALASLDTEEVVAEKHRDRNRQLARHDDGSIDPLMNAEPVLGGIDLDRIEEDLKFIDPDVSYPEWMDVIRAVHHQTRGSEEGFDLIDAWSQEGGKYEDGIVQAKWDELNTNPKSGGKPTTYRTIIKMVETEKAEEAVHERDRLLDEIENCSDESMLEKGLPKKVSKAKHLTPLGRKLLETALGKRQKIVMTVAMTAVELRAACAPETRVVAAAQSTSVDTRYTHFGLAEQLYDMIGANLIFSPESQVWYRWNRGYWQEYPIEAIRRSAQQMIDDLPRNIPDGLNNAQTGEYLAWCIKAQSVQMVEATVKLLPGVPGSNMIVPGAEMDNNPWKFGVRNGTIDLKSGELNKASRDDLITRVTACDYDPAAECPLFEQVVNDAFFGDAAMIEWFHRVIGYSLIGDPKEQFFVIPYGLGSNGKGTILNSIREVLGMHAAATPYTTFLTDGKQAVSATGPNEALLRLKGSRFVYMSEPEAGMQLRASLIKSVTGGDELQARGVHAKKSVAFKPTWVIFMPTNHKPIVKDDDNGIWRRIRLVPFERNFDTDREIAKDTDLVEKLKAEYEGILAWCVAGAAKYLRFGLGDQPRQVSDAHVAYKTDMDVLHEWLEDHWIADPLAFSSMAELYSSWERYAERNGLTFKGSSRWLSMKLQDRGFKTHKGKGGTRGYRGLTRRERSADDEGFDKA